jgi:nitrogen regulatory protein PII
MKKIIAIVMILMLTGCGMAMDNVGTVKVTITENQKTYNIGGDVSGVVSLRQLEMLIETIKEDNKDLNTGEVLIFPSNTYISIRVYK